ncbi:MAG: tRNA (adenosine(37)-N6)-dimethylallyltransferase MiaA [Lachnospiraceae bacterium]|nr:tRNA (adenosine(37)-N6)-dimethylallyltransferase MiaA [Lachnospiraceae bacterium]
MKKPLIILTGPTAVGKSKLSISLAKAVGGQIISADSMQVYEKMDIGTAKITPKEMDGVKHHLIDIMSPKEEFNVALFQKFAYQAMETIYAEGDIPIIVGGTGFYIQAVLYDISFNEGEEERPVRHRLEEEAKQLGKEALWKRLLEVDEASANAIHPNNIKRVIRALEFYELTGEKFSLHNENERQKESPYAFKYFVLSDERSKLYQRIEQRVDLMVEQGLVEEVRKLKEMGCTKDMVSMQGLGYKEILAYLDGDCSLEDAIYKIKLETRHFAKRQLTWFRREKTVEWIDKSQYDSEEDILKDMMQQLRKEGIVS